MKMLIFICIVSRTIPLLSQELDLQSAGANIDAEHQEILRFLDQLASAPAEVPSGPERGYRTCDDLTLRGRKFQVSDYGQGTLTKNDLERAGGRPYASNQILGCMGLLAAIAAEMVGTAQQGAQAALLSHYAGQLSGNSDPGLQQAAVVMGQESQAVATGDSADATTLAQSFANIPGNVIPAAYQPSAEDSSLTATLQAVESNAWAAALMTLGKAAMAGLLATMQGGVYGAVVGFAASLVESSIQGNLNGQTSSAAGIGAAMGAIEGNLGSTGGQTPNGIGTGLSGLEQIQAASGSVVKNSTILAAPTGAGDQVVQPGNGSADRGAFVGSQLIQ